MGTAFPSFILRQPSVATVQSLEPSELLMLSYSAREMLFEKVRVLEIMYRKELELDYIASVQRIESLITMDAKQRYAALLENNPNIVWLLPAKIVADYLGISQETEPVEGKEVRGRQYGKS